MPIRILPQHLSNQIAAGEVIERPSSAVKELAENALDAGATQLRVSVVDGGLTRLEVLDNGSGMTPEDLPLATARHATSKIRTTEDLFSIHTFGFRGEALPSIASVARLTLTSRAQGSDEAWSLLPDGTLKPAALPQGTRVEVADLFYATPARRKFLKSARTERNALFDVLLRLALANPALTLTLVEDGAETWHIPAAPDDFFTGPTPRLRALLGDTFAQAAQPVHVTTQRPEGTYTLTGFISHPHAHTSNAQQQYLFVNGRPIKDRTLSAALKQAYADRLPATRHPMAALFLTLPPTEVDVNVHPAKSEVRFRDPNGLFGFLYAAVRQTLSNGAPQASPSLPQTAPFTPFQAPQLQAFPSVPTHTHIQPKGYEGFEDQKTNSPPCEALAEQGQSFALGQPMGQIDATYIIAQTADSLVIIDQHAAHERLVYEQLKSQFAHGNIPSQQLLLPTTVSVTPAQAALAMAHAAELEKFGLYVESLSPTALVVTGLPQLLSEANPTTLLTDILNDLSDLSPRTTLQARVEHVLATLACHHSIRAHRRLSLAEQNALLRQMEETPASLTCNHGRPTVKTFPLQTLQKLFDRT